MKFKGVSLGWFSLILVGSVCAVQGANLTWTNTAGGLWAVASNWSPNQIPSAADNLTIAAAGNYTVTVQGTQNAARLTIGGAGSSPTVRLESTSSVNTALTVANTLTNLGTIEMLNVTGGGVATLNVTAGALINETGATIRVLPGSGGTRQLNAQLDNRGTLEILTNLTINRGGAKHTNSGTINLAGGNLTLTQSGTAPSFTTTGSINIPTGRTNVVSNGTFNYASGTIGGGGTWELNNVVLNLTPDLSNESTFLDLSTTTVNGPGRLINAAGRTLTLANGEINAPLDNRGELKVQGVVRFNGPVNDTPGALLSVQSTVSVNTALTVANSLTNLGTIEILNVTGGGVATLNVTAGALVNETGATIRVLPGSGGTRQLNAQLDNRGTLEILTNLTINRGGAKHTNSGTINLAGGNLTLTQSGTAPSFTTTGSINIPAGRTNVVSNGTFNYASGTIGGGGTWELNNVVLNLTPDLSNESTFLDLSTTTVNGPGRLINAAGRTLTLANGEINAPLDNRGEMKVQGVVRFNGPVNDTPGALLSVQSTVSVNTALTVANTLTNLGTIEILNVTGGGVATLNVTAGALVNETGATIRVLPGSGGTRQLNAQLDNRGSLDVEAPLTVTKAGAHHSNSGTINVAGGPLLFSLTGSTPSLTSQGHLLIRGTNTVQVNNGSFTNAAPGVISGTGTLNISTTAFKDTGVVNPGDSLGTLTLLGNFNPTPESELQVDLGGYERGTNYDHLTVTGSANLTGILRPKLVTGFLPKKDDSFIIFSAAALTGTFDRLESPDTNHVAWGLLYTSTNVTLVVSNTSPIIPSTLGDTNLDETIPWTLSTAAVDHDTPTQTLSYQLVSGPAGMTLDAASGLISWTPTEAQGPSTNTVTVSVTDNGTPPLSDTRSFNVIVHEINTRPTFVAAAPVIDESVPWEMSAAAADSDLPQNPLRYELISGPPGLVLDPATGTIRWTPNESNGPGTETVILKVTDTNVDASVDRELSATNTFQVRINEVNTAPVLTLPADQTLKGPVPFSATATAIDSDLPANPLTFSLVSGPAGMTVTTTGLIQWTPATSQVPSTNTVVIRVTDDNPGAIPSPQLSVTNQFVLKVIPENHAPVLPDISTQTIDELTELRVVASANDTDLPANQLSYTLLTAPAGAQVDADGTIRWTPAEAQGPSTNRFILVVTDDGVPSLSATNTFDAVVREVNSAPTLSLINDLQIPAESAFSLPLNASDGDLPTNQLTFVLLASPTGASLDRGSGLFTWKPTAQDEGTTNTVTVQVSDDGSPSLNDTRTFRILVSSTIQITSVEHDSSKVTLVWTAAPGRTYRVQFKNELEEPNWTDLPVDVTATSATASKEDITIGAHPRRYYRIQGLP